MGRKSTRENKTIYQKLREENDLTREKAAELLAFISEDRLERIENEKSEPAPEDVIVRVMLCMSLPVSAAPTPLKTITPTRDLAAVVP